MNAIVSSLSSMPAALSGISGLVSIVPMLMAAIAYFHYEMVDPEARPINVEQDKMSGVYDFIIVGGGSAGENCFHYSDIMRYLIM